MLNIYLCAAYLCAAWISEVRIIFYINAALSDLSSEEPSKFVVKIYCKKNYRISRINPSITTTQRKWSFKEFQQNKSKFPYPTYKFISKFSFKLYLLLMYLIPLFLIAYNVLVTCFNYFFHNSLTYCNLLLLLIFH